MTPDRIEIPAFTDAHVHLRQDSMLRQVAPYTGVACDNAVVMPNTTPSIHDDHDIIRYRGECRGACGSQTGIHMTAKWLPRTAPHEFLRAKQARVLGYKLYPAGVTTNSDDGIPWEWLADPSLKQVRVALEQMEALGLVLLCHGESDGFVLDREREFLSAFYRIHKEFPKLRMTLEHITTVEAVSMVRELNRRRPGSVLGTITLHHLETTLDDVIGGHLKPHLFCKPIPKRSSDRRVLLDAALSGEAGFALGSDSAPHYREAKESVCGCAGVFTAPVLAPGVVSLFDRENSLDLTSKFEPPLFRFTSGNANNFYGFKRSGRRLTLERRPFVVPPSCGQTIRDVVPYRAGETLPWSLVDGE